MISYGADINQCRDSTPLLTAISFQKWDIANFLLDHGADSNAAGGSPSSTPLTLAAGKSGSGTTVAKLLEHGADLNTPDNIGNTALINAASSGQTDVMKLLLDHGAKVGIKGILGTALAASYDLERADLLISHGATVDDWVPALIGQDARLDSEQKALFRAVTTDNVRGMAAIPNSVSKEFPGGLTPLFLAIKLTRTNVTDWLLEHGAVANERDARGMSPLHWAVIADTQEPQRKIGLIDSLLKHGASIDVTEVCYGMTALHFAAALFYSY